MVYTVINVYSDLLKKYKLNILVKKELKLIATEARKYKEALIIRYLEKMSSLEQNLPVDNDQISHDHHEFLLVAIEDYSKYFGPFGDQEFVLIEKQDLVSRLEIHLAEIKETNFQKSYEHCKKLWETLYEDLRHATLEKSENGFNVQNLELKWLHLCHAYKAQAKGPASDTVFIEEFVSIIPFMTNMLRSAEHDFCEMMQKLDVLNITIEKLNSEKRNEEEGYKEKLEESKKYYEDLLLSRDGLIQDLNLNKSTQIANLEARVKSLQREVVSLKYDLEQSRYEKDSILKNEKQHNARLLSEHEYKINSLKLENEKFLSMIHELREEKEALIQQKNESLRDATVNFAERTSEFERKAEYMNFMQELKYLIEDVINRYDTEITKNYESVAQIANLTAAQKQINEIKVMYEAEMNQLREAYQQEIYKESLKIAENEAELAQKKVLIEQERDIKTNYYEAQVSKLNDDISDIKSKLKVQNEKVDSYKAMLEESDQQMQALYEVMEIHRKQIESYSNTLTETNFKLEDHKLKLALLTDDNLKLIEFMGALLNYSKKNSQQLRVSFSRIVDSRHKEAISKLLSAKGIKWE